MIAKPFPFSEKPCLADIGELPLLARIKEWLGSVAPEAPMGMGDDAAVLPPTSGKENLLLTCDSLTYGRHFDSSACPRQVGRKLLTRNLSDIAAMGGAPSHAVVALCSGGNLSLHWLEEFYRGLAETAVKYNCLICGGDLSQTENSIFISSMTLMGSARTPKLRTGAQKDDTIWVTGDFGGSLLGKHLSFEPRLSEGQWLAGQKAVHAMMDMTDGLATDLLQFCQEGKGIELQAGAIPISSHTRQLAKQTGQSDLWHALHDGEDYELAFVLSGKEKPEEFESRWKQEFSTPVTCIGTVQDISSMEKKIAFSDTDNADALHGPGYEHFRNPSPGE